MLLLNFSHPLTPEQIAQIEALSGQPVDDLRAIPVQFDPDRPFAPQAEALVQSVALSPEDWQTRPILIVPPSLNVIAALLLAELHGRMGYFPAVLRLKLAPGSTPPRYEIAEILNLQAVRDAARKSR